MRAYRGHLLHIGGAPLLAEAGTHLVSEPDGVLIVDDDGAIAFSGAYARVPADMADAEVIDCRPGYLLPGFIDTHLHIESSLITPHEFDRCVLPHGVTTAIWDPHEIANVLGTQGIDYALSAAEAAVMDIRVNLSSCVPASPLETALRAADDGEPPSANDPEAVARALTRLEREGLIRRLTRRDILLPDPEALGCYAGWARQPI